MEFLVYWEGVVFFLGGGKCQLYLLWAWTLPPRAAVRTCVAGFRLQTLVCEIICVNEALTAWPNGFLGGDIHRDPRGIFCKRIQRSNTSFRANFVLRKCGSKTHEMEINVHSMWSIVCIASLLLRLLLAGSQCSRRCQVLPRCFQLAASYHLLYSMLVPWQGKTHYSVYCSPAFDFCFITHLGLW